MQNDLEPDSRNELLWHENVAMRVVQMTVIGQDLESWYYGYENNGISLVVYIVAWAEAYLRSKWHLDSSSRLATISSRDIRSFDFSSS